MWPSVANSNSWDGLFPHTANGWLVAIREQYCVIGLMLSHPLLQSKPNLLVYLHFKVSLIILPKPSEGDKGLLFPVLCVTYTSSILLATDNRSLSFLPAKPQQCLIPALFITFFFICLAVKVTPYIWQQWWYCVAPNTILNIWHTGATTPFYWTGLFVMMLLLIENGYNACTKLLFW